MDWKMIFDGWLPILRTLVLGTLGYAGLVILLRISGKRTLSKMNAFDLVVTIAFGSILATMATSRQVSLVQGLVAMGLLILLQFVCTCLSVRFQAFQQLIKSQPTLVFFKGEFLLDAMREQRLTKDEVLAAMREQGGTSPNEVDAVVLETEGSLSVMRNDMASVNDLASLGVQTSEQPRE